MFNTTSERLKARNVFICQYFSFYEQLKFRVQLSSLCAIIQEYCITKQRPYIHNHKQQQYKINKQQQNLGIGTNGNKSHWEALIYFTGQKVSEYDQEIPQPHSADQPTETCEEEAQNINSNKTSGGNKSKTINTLFLVKMIAK